ncbi:MAG: molybdopterin molybdotransferase MoeA [Gammaproteobacteria bacterium]|nr:molybdopterin molybdotransferase MoeA [Gammaproteobacteria bacterium]
MISYQAALRLILDHCDALPPVQTKLRQLLGTAPIDNIRSQMNVPSFNNSAMDGYALHADDSQGATAEHPVELIVCGMVAAGQTPGSVEAGQAMEIMTGAPLPDNCDAVIPVERVTIATTGEQSVIRLSDSAHAGQNVRLAGQDFEQDQTLFYQGSNLEPHHLMGLAATGTDSLDVREQPRIALITTGSELAQEGVTEGTSLIRDSNGPYLRACFEHMGIEVISNHSTSDDPQALQQAIDDASQVADIVLTTGGVSAGRYDLVPGAINALGGETLFHKVSIRPGKPLLFARMKNGALFFGLPGNPIAVAVGLRFFVIPAIRALQGLKPETALHSVCESDMESKRELTFFGKARVNVDTDGRLITTLLPGQESFKINSLMQANCWIIVPENIETLAAGDQVEIVPLYPDALKVS